MCKAKKEPVYYLGLSLLDSFSLRAGETEVRVINVGCAVKDILVPDKAGKVVDVCLGYVDLKSKKIDLLFGIRI